MFKKKYTNKEIFDKKDDEFVNEKTYPVQAADWILNNLDVQNIKLFN